MHVLIIGHSFPRRLRYLLFPTANNSSILPFPAANFSTQIIAQGGATLEGPKSILFHQHIHSIPQGTHVVFISMGTNDLSMGAQPRAVAAQLYFHALRCLNQFGARLVMIEQILPRDTSLYPGFSALATETNAVLAQIIHMGSNPSVILFKHKFDPSVQPHLLARDGVHLSPRGMRRYARDIRGALLEAQRLLN